jgi:hypothetical protein
MKNLFPEMENTENKERVLCGLEITKVVSNLYGVVLKLECKDAQGELHEIEFKCCGVIVVDGDTALTTNTGMF